MKRLLGDSRDNRSLNLSRLGLTSLPEMPDQLQELDVSGNQLTSLPENLPAQLQKLKVSRNRLTSLPKNLPDQLQELDVSSNRLTSLPENLPDQLQKLYVINNQLASLPENLPASLQQLHVSKNRLISLPENLPASLQQLHVSNNRLTSLPQRLPPRLTWLDVSGNRLTSLPENLPDQIRVLGVSNNRLPSLPENLPTSLHHLYASDNQLLSLPENLPASLQQLYVARNQLASLPENLPPRLIWLDVSGNRLVSLPEHIATTLTLGRRCRVDLHNNLIPAREQNHLRAMNSDPTYPGPQFLLATPFLFDSEGPSDAAPVRPLANAVADWHGEGQEDVKTAWRAFDNENGAAEFSQFLDRLRRTVNYGHPEFRQGVVAWLSDLAGDPKLRNDSFVVSVGATASCEDRVSLTYNDMKKVRLVSDVENGRYDDRLGELVEVARGMYRLDQLEKIARKKVKSLKYVDEIEVYLAYQVKLRETLKLPLDTPDMRFFAVSWVTDDDLTKAEAQVKSDENAHFINYLSTEWEPWQAVAKRLDNTGFEETQEKVLAHIEESFEAQRNAGYAELDRKIDDASHRLEQLRATLPSEMPEVEVKAQLEPIEQEREEYQRQVRVLPATLAKEMAYPIKAEAARALLQERGLPLSLLDPQWQVSIDTNPHP